MSVRSAFRIWLLAVVFAVAVAWYGAFKRFQGSFPDFGYATTSVAAAVVLTLIALAISVRSPRFNLTVAAETIVVYGVMCLIVGLGTAVIYSSIKFRVEGVKLDELGSIAGIFVEGLITAAICPMLAMLLRFRDAQTGLTDISKGPDLAGAAHAADELTTQLQNVTSNLADLNKQLENEVSTFQEATRSVGAAAKTLAESLREESDRTQEALHRVEAGAKGFAAASEKSREAVNLLGSDLSNLSKSSNEARTLLDALATLIVSVKRFIPSGPARR